MHRRLPVTVLAGLAAVAVVVAAGAAFAKSLPPKAGHSKSRERKSTSMSPLVRSR